MKMPNICVFKLIQCEDLLLFCFVEISSCIFGGCCSLYCWRCFEYFVCPIYINEGKQNIRNNSL